MHYLPKELNTHLPNLEVIKIDSTELKEIHREDLEPFKELRELTISGNLIEELEKDLFVGNVNLEKVIMDNNRIRFIHPKVFSGEKLVYIFLDRNWCMHYNTKWEKSPSKPKFDSHFDDCMKDEYRLEIGIDKLIKDANDSMAMTQQLERDIQAISVDIKSINTTLKTLKDQRESVEVAMGKTNNQLVSLASLVGDSALDEIKETLDSIASGFSNNTKKFHETLKSFNQEILPEFLRAKEKVRLQRRQLDFTDNLDTTTPLEVTEVQEITDDQSSHLQNLKVLVGDFFKSLTTLDLIYIAICVAEFILIIALLSCCCCCKAPRSTSETVEKEEPLSNVCFDGDYQAFTLPHDRSRYQIDVIDDYGPTLDCIQYNEDDNVEYDNVLLENAVVDMEVPSELW